MKENKDYSLVMCSCDSYSDTWVPFFKCWTRHWPQFDKPIYIISESQSMPNNVGLDIRYPLHKKGANRSWTWSKCLEEAIKEVETDYILFLLDDFWLYDRVDTELFEKVINIIKSDEAIGFILLAHINKLNKFDKSCEYEDLLECQKGKPFRLTTQSGIWRRDFLLKMLRAHESAWEFEPRASWRSRIYGHKRVFCLNYNKHDDIFKYPSAGTLQAGKIIEDHMHYFKGSMYEDCIHRGLIKRDAPRIYPSRASKISKLVSMLLSILPK